MSELAKEARAKMKAKAERMTSADPNQKVDASSWTPPPALMADKITGMRPVTRKTYKAGGSVEGAKEMQRADRAPRKSGGIANEIVNRDLKEANLERKGYARTDGYKTGGPVKRAMGGTNIVPTSRLGFVPAGSMMLKAAGMKDGGEAQRKADRIARITGTRPTGGREAFADGGNVRTSRPDEPWQNSETRASKRISANRDLADAKASYKDRQKDVASRRRSDAKISKIEHRNFGNGIDTRPTNLYASESPPEKGDWSRLKVGRHSIQNHQTGETWYKGKKGLLKTSDGIHQNSRFKADGGRVARAEGGKVGKGPVSVNIIIADKGQGQQPAITPAAMAAMMPKPPMPPMAGPAAGAPPPMAGPPPGPIPPQMMPRKRGGRTVHMEAGAGSGLGRLEKIEEYGGE